VAGDLQHRELALRSVRGACAEAVPACTPGDTSARTFCDELISAVSEAFNNIALHGYRNLPLGHVDLEVLAEAEKVMVIIRDEGHSYDPRNTPPPCLESLPEGGMGAFIMRHFVDEMSYTPGPPNTLTLTKRLR
jgi:serine/threonine-protein kinase RsbW